MILYWEWLIHVLLVRPISKTDYRDVPTHAGGIVWPRSFTAL